MKVSYIIAIVLIAVLIGIIVSAYGKTSEYGTFKTAGENQGKTYSVIGHLDRSREMVYDAVKDPNYFSFFLQDSTKDVRQVVFHSPKPADFERSQNVVIKGKMDGDVFEAKEILLKCPSKYNDAKIETKEYSAN